MTDFGTPGSFPSPPMPPSSAARTGPPWEQPGAFFQRWLDTAKGILLDPQGGFRNVRRTGGLGAPMTYYAVGAAPAIIGYLLFSVLGMGMGMMGGGGDAAAGAAIMGGGMIGGLVMAIVMYAVMFFVLSGLVHLVLSLLGGARHGFEATVRTIAYSFGSALPIGLIPMCGFVGAIWALVCAIFGLADLHETTPVKAAIALLSPIALCCVVGMLFYAAIMAMVLGSAAAMQ